MTTELEHRQDLDLAGRAAAGEESAWREIYDASCQNLFGLLVYQTGDRDAAKDLLQETFVTAMRKLSHYRGQGPLGGWLRTIALRKSLDWKRSLMRQAKRKLALLAESDTESPAAEAPRFDTEREALDTALKSLSGKQRAALLLREYEQMSFAEIAETIGCSEPTARVHHHRAREAMRRRMGGSPDNAIADEMEGLRP